MLKLTNLTCWSNNQFRVQKWNFDQKTQISNIDIQAKIFMWDHEETCFYQKNDLFHEFWMKMYECSLESVSWSHGSLMNEKFQSLERICFEMRTKVEVNENFKFSNLEKFYHLKNLDGMEKLAYSKFNPLS